VQRAQDSGRAQPLSAAEHSRCHVRCRCLVPAALAGRDALLRQHAGMWLVAWMLCCWLPGCSAAHWEQHLWVQQLTRMVTHVPRDPHYHDRNPRGPRSRGPRSRFRRPYKAARRRAGGNGLLVCCPSLVPARVPEGCCGVHAARAVLCIQDCTRAVNPLACTRALTHALEQGRCAPQCR